MLVVTRAVSDRAQRRRTGLTTVAIRDTIMSALGGTLAPVVSVHDVAMFFEGRCQAQVPLSGLVPSLEVAPGRDHKPASRRPRARLCRMPQRASDPVHVLIRADKPLCCTSRRPTESGVHACHRRESRRPQTAGAHDAGCAYTGPQISGAKRPRRGGRIDVEPLSAPVLPEKADEASERCGVLLSARIAEDEPV